MELPKSRRELFVRGAQFASRLPFLYYSFREDHPYRVHPLNVDINITDRCNFICLTCRGADPDYQSKSEIDFDTMKSILDDMSQMRIPYLTLAGGEPMLRYDFVLETLRYAGTRGVTVGMVTNGSLLNEQRMVELAEAGLHRIAFSLDGATEEVHDHIRMKGSYAKVLANLAMCQQLKKERGYNFRVHVNSVVTRFNLDQLVKTAQIAKKFGAVVLFQAVDVPQVELQVDSDPAQSATISALAVDQSGIGTLEKEVGRLLELQKEDAVVANLTWQLHNAVGYYRSLCNTTTTSKSKCYVGFNTIHIESDGSFGSCIFLPSVGNVNEAGLQAAWKSAAYAKQRVAIAKCRRPCALNCFYPMSLGLLAHDFGYLPLRRAFHSLAG